MRSVVCVLIPLILHLMGYAAAVSATTGGGSFVGLLIIPFALFSIPSLLWVGIRGVRQGRPLGSLLRSTLLIALAPPIVILILRAVEG